MIALLVPVLMLLLMLALEAFENLVFPPPRTPPSEDASPEPQSSE